MSNSLEAVILAGGLGTRLRSVVADRPKVLATVAGRPFITRLLDQLVATGINRVVLCTGYKAELVEATLGESYRGMTLVYSVESEPLGTGGAVRLALAKLNASTVLMMNGDSFCAADLSSFTTTHAARQAKASMLLTEMPDTSRFGRVEFAADGHVTAFIEKGQVAGPGWINAGIYLLDRTLLAEIEPGRAVSLEREVFPTWVAQRTLMADALGKRFLDIGTPESFAAAESFFQA